MDVAADGPERLRRRASRMSLAGGPSSSQHSHFLLLYKHAGAASPRQYKQVPSGDVEVLCEVVLTMCEEELAGRRQHGSAAADHGGGNVSTGGGGGYDASSITTLRYDAADLLNFLDGFLEEVVVLAFDLESRKYTPHGRPWIKSRLFSYLRGLIHEGPPASSVGDGPQQASRRASRAAIATEVANGESQVRPI